MKRIVFLAGLPGTGKSAFAKTLSYENKTSLISADETRYSITKDYTVLAPGMTVYQMMVDQAKKELSENDDITIIFDSTFLDDKRRNFFLDQLPKVDETIIYLLKVHDENIIFQRNKSRRKDKWVPEDVIREMMTRYANPSKENESRYTKIVEVYVDERK